MNRAEAIEALRKYKVVAFKHEMENLFDAYASGDESFAVILHHKDHPPNIVTTSRVLQYLRYKGIEPANVEHYESRSNYLCVKITF